MPGCTNHGCFIEPRKARGTNGMCHCLDVLGKENARALKKRLFLLQRTIQAQAEMLAAYRLGKAALPEWVHLAMEKAREEGLFEKER